MKCVSAMSTRQETPGAVDEVLSACAGALGSDPADLAVAFASPQHGEGLAKLAEELRTRGLARHVVGCTGESIVGDAREVEGAPALSVWTLGGPGIEVRPVRLRSDGGDVTGAVAEADAASEGPEAPCSILLGDPFTFPADAFLRALRARSPAHRVVGGMASASQVPRGNRLVLDQDVYRDGAVAVSLTGNLRVSTVVSQGCRPVGRTFIVTKADQNVIRELGRRPALEVLREMFEGLPDEEQELVQGGLHIGRVINEYQETFRRGDFLVRNVLGADDEGGIAVTDVIRVGQTVQFHVRDAATADEDLRSLLETHDPGGDVRGALLFTCNGRGTRLFPGPDHDAGALRDRFGPLPVAGFFAMGEVGPVGGQNFVHGFTASVTLFAERAGA